MGDVSFLIVPVPRSCDAILRWRLTKPKLQTDEGRLKNSYHGDIEIISQNLNTQL